MSQGSGGVRDVLEEGAVVVLKPCLDEWEGEPSIGVVCHIAIIQGVTHGREVGVARKADDDWMLRVAQVIAVSMHGVGGTQWATEEHASSHSATIVRLLAFMI